MKLKGGEGDGFSSSWDQFTMAFVVATGLYSAGDSVWEAVSLALASDLRESHTMEKAACQESCSLLASLASRSALVGPQGSLGHSLAGRWTMGCLGMAIGGLYQALEMGVLLLGILTGSKSCLLGPGPDAAAAPLLRRGMGHLRQI